MNTFEEQLKRVGKEIRLSKEERTMLRGKLVSEIAQTSLPTVPRRMYSRTLMNNRLKKTMPIALIIALLMSGSVSYAAEGTAPGDTLYPVKIHVNEGMRGVLAVSDSAKAKLEVELAERRLFEAEHLKSEDRLDATTTALLREQFSSHRSRADEHLKELKEKQSDDADKIAEDFSERLRGHHSVLSEFGFDNDEDDDRRSGSTTNEEENDSMRRGRGTDSEGDRQRGTSSSRGSEIETRRGDDEKVEREVEVEHSRGDDTSSSGSQSGRGSRSDDGDDEEDDDRSGRGSGGTVLPTPPVTPPATPPVVSSTGTPVTSYTLAAIASHNTATSCYTAISGSVYDLTPFITGHPGGSTAILSLCGHDGTAGFLAQHAGMSRPQSMLAGLRIGTLAN